MSAGENTHVSRFRKRTSEHNLYLDVNAANLRARHEECLPHCQYASPECRTVTVGTSCACDEDVVEEGKDLFTNFLREEIDRSGLHKKARVISPWIVDTPFGYQNPVWAKAGRELREMADAFSKTKERQRLKKRAWSLPICGMSYQQFRDFLTELFLGDGVTVERIVVLFFFCSDLALSSLERSAADVFKRCVDWAVKFISEKVCGWVRDHGGWCMVLSRSVQFVGPRFIGAVVILGLAMSIWHFLRRS